MTIIRFSTDAVLLNACLFTRKVIAKLHKVIMPTAN